MGRKCFVPNCKSGYASSEKRVRSFKAPRDPKRLKAWAKAIGRTDKQLTPDCYVCEEHFPSSAVKRQKYFGEYKGNILLEHPKRSVLEENAVPTLKLSRATDATTETASSGIVDKASDMSATSSDQSQDDGEGSPEKAARVDGATSPVMKKPALPVKNSDASGTGAPVTETQELATGTPGEQSSISSAPNNALTVSTPKSTASSTVTLNSSSPFLMHTTAPARFTLSSTMSAVSPMTATPPVMLQRTLTPFAHIGAPSTLTLNRALPPMALNSSPSTLLLMPVALIPKPGDSNSPASVAMRVVPGNAQMPTNHPPGKMTTALAFRLTAPAPAVMKKPVAVPAAVPAKRADSRQQQPNDLMVKEEVLSEESGDSAGGSSDDGGGFAEPTAAAKKTTSARTPKTGEPNPGAVRLPLSMALGADQVLLPSPAWNHHDVDIESTNSRSLCFVELQSSPTSGPPFTRCILQIVQSSSHNYSIKCYVLDREVEVTVLPTGAPPPTVEEIAETLQDFNSRTVCRGGLARRDLPGARFERAWLDKTGVWRHDRCPLLLYGGETLCKFCASLPNPFNPPTTSTIDKSKLQQKHGTRSRVKAETLKL